MNLEAPSSRSFLKLLYEGQLSRRNELSFRDYVAKSRVDALRLSTSREILSNGHVVSVLALDRIDYRYVLSGGINGAVSLYDLESFSVINGRCQTKAICSTNANTKGFLSVTSVQWYPEDCGLFATANLGGELLIYDTNQFCVANQFQFSDQRINAAKMKSSSDTAGPLVAVGLSNGHIHLCDLVSGDSSHILLAHSRAVTSVDWSPINSFQLCSSSVDGTIRVWDIRKGGTEAGLLWLDWRQDHTAVATVDNKRLTSTKEPEPIRRNGVEIVQDSSSTKPYRHLSTSTAVLSSSSSSYSSKGAAAALTVGKAHDQAVMSMRYSPDGNYILSAGNDQRLRLWSAHTGRLQPIHYDIPVSSGRVMPYQLEVMQVSSKACEDVIVLPDQSGSGTSGSGSSSNSNGSGGSGDLLLVPLHSADGQATGRLKGHLGPVNAAVYRRPCQQLVTAGKDGLILLWEPITDGCIASTINTSSNSSSGGLGGSVVDEDSWSVEGEEATELPPPPPLRQSSRVLATMTTGGSNDISSSAYGKLGGQIMRDINQLSTVEVGSNNNRNVNSSSISSGSSALFPTSDDVEGAYTEGSGINWGVIDAIIIETDDNTSSAQDDEGVGAATDFSGAVSNSNGPTNAIKKKIPDRRAGILKQLNKRRKA